MKKEKPKVKEKETPDLVEEQAIEEATIAVAKEKKTKPKKVEKEIAEPKDVKSPKDDKLTKFLVSMKKTVRKSIKKEAAEMGVSMNEFILLAIEEKLEQEKKP